MVCRAVHINTQEEFKLKLEEAQDTLVVVDFFATWCGPCKMIAPEVDQLAEDITNVVFLKVDVDVVGALAEEYDISSMPTFLFIKNGEVVARFSGASIDKLKTTIATLTKA